MQKLARPSVRLAPQENSHLRGAQVAHHVPQTSIRRLRVRSARCASQVRCPMLPRVRATHAKAELMQQLVTQSVEFVAMAPLQLLAAAAVPSAKRASLPSGRAALAAHAKPVNMLMQEAHFAPRARVVMFQIPTSLRAQSVTQDLKQSLEIHDV